MNTLYPWDKLPNKGSFFVPGMPTKQVVEEILKDVGRVGYNVRIRVGVLHGKYGVLVTRRD